MRHVRAFVAVAEELNFTRAAERLHLAQQALSTQIRQLEERVGTRLVDRSTRHVALTPAGEAFLEQVRPLLISVEQAVAAAHAADRGTERLTVGFLVGILHERVAQVLELFRARRPDVEVFVHFGDFLDSSAGLRTEPEVDVALVYGPGDRTGLALQYLWTDPLGAILAADHPLAQREFGARELLAEPTFEFPTRDPIWKAYWMQERLRQEYGLPARVVAQFKGIDALIEAARAGLGVHVASSLLGASLPPDRGVIFREMPELDPLHHYFATRAGDDRPIVREFLAAAREVFPQVGEAPAGETGS